MSTGHLNSPVRMRHSDNALAVPPSMTTFRAAMPWLRALILAMLAVAVILFGLPAVLTFGAAAPL